MDAAPTTATLSAIARPRQSELEEDIARLRQQILRQQILFWLYRMVGLNPLWVRERLHRSIDTIACLHYRRQSRYEGQKLSPPIRSCAAGRGR